MQRPNFVNFNEGDGFMSFNYAEEVLNVLSAIRKQTEKEKVIREAMLEILNQGRVEDDEISQNFDFGVSLGLTRFISFLLRKHCILKMTV